MADDVNWQIEYIPDEDSAYMRAHRDFIRDGILQPGVFREHNGGMSVDWEKYSSAGDTRQRAKKPADNAVIELSVGGVRRINKLDVIHNPKPMNRAHSDVVGLPDDSENLTETRALLLGVSSIILALS
jgi:hypothetical protein